MKWKKPKEQATEMDQKIVNGNIRASQVIFQPKNKTKKRSKGTKQRNSQENKPKEQTEGANQRNTPQEQSKEQTKGTSQRNNQKENAKKKQA